MTPTTPLRRFQETFCALHRTIGSCTNVNSCITHVLVNHGQTTHSPNAVNTPESSCALQNPISSQSVCSRACPDSVNRSGDKPGYLVPKFIIKSKARSLLS